MGRKKKQPWGITLNCIVLALVATICIIGAIGLAVLGAMTLTVGLIPIAGIAAGVAFFMLLFGITTGTLCYFLWIHNVFAWWAVLIISALCLLSAIFTLPYGLMSVLMGIALVAGLIHKDTIKAIKPGIDYKGWG